MLHLIRKEPVLFQAVIQAGLALAVSFGVGLDATQTGSLLAFSAAMLSFITRTQVTPVANPKLPDGTPLTTRQTAATV